MKGNIRLESSRRDRATGRTRLKNMELLPMIISWIEFSAAALPSNAEFAAFWEHLLSRMASSQSPTDNAIAACPRQGWIIEYLFDTLAILLFYPLRDSEKNSQEVSHRVLKAYLRPGFQKRGIRPLMVEVCETIATRVAKGDFGTIVGKITEPWEELFQCDRKRLVDDSSAALEEDTQKARLFVLSHCVCFWKGASKFCWLRGWLFFFAWLAGEAP